MKTGILIFLVFIMGSPSLRADDDSAALDKLRKIPPTPANINWDQFKKPISLMLTARGAFINDSTTAIPFDQVLKALAHLPKESWPCGRVIIFYPFGPGLTAEARTLPADAKKVEAALKTAGIWVLMGDTD